MLQQLMPIYEPLFSDDSFGYRPGRGEKDAIFRIKEYKAPRREDYAELGIIHLMTR